VHNWFRPAPEAFQGALRRNLMSNQMSIAPRAGSTSRMGMCWRLPPLAMGCLWIRSFGC
jgi:hypothetical protein